MRRWRFTKSHTGTELLRQFAILSSIVIGLITVALSLVISHYLRKDLLGREWRITADYTRAEALYHLTPADFAAPMTRQARENFKNFHEQTVMMPEIVRVKIYDPDMTVIWSDEPRLIGRRFPGNQELVSALAGRTMVNVTTDPQRKGEDIVEEHDTGHFVEVYVPIVFPGNSRVAGVVETYKLPEQVFANIRRGWLVVVGIATAGGILLYLALFGIVRLTARRLESQRALTAHLQALREDERSAIAHEAREQLAQVLSAVKLDLSRLAASALERPEVLRAKTKEMQGLLDIAMKSALEIASDARPGLLDTLGLGAALDWEARRYRARTGIECRFTSGFEDFDLDRDRRTLMFRCFQEILANVARHAGATRVTIALETEAGRLVLTVEDNGRGITDREIADPKSLGLLVMRESALLMGGDLAVTGVRSRGTRVTLTVPVDWPERPALRAAKAE